MPTDSCLARHLFRRETIFTARDPQPTERPGLLGFKKLWSAIAKKSKLPLLCIDSVVRIDQHYCIKHVTQDHLLQHAQNL
jgi:N-glycosylase/DNA lyase